MHTNITRTRVYIHGNHTNTYIVNQPVFPDCACARKGAGERKMRNPEKRAGSRDRDIET